MSNKETAQEIFNTALDNVAEGESIDRDATVVAMVQAGCSLNSAQIWYKAFADEAGLTVKRIGHKDEALEHIAASGVDILDDEARTALKAELKEKFGVAASTANDYVKAYAKQEGIELPTSGFGGNPEDQEKIYSWIAGNPDCTKDEFKGFMAGEMGRSSGSIDETWRGIVLARRLAGDKVKFAKAS